MDIFCRVQTKLKNQLIYTSDSFLIIHDGFPLKQGHLLLIPKKHFSCFAEVYQDRKLTTELKKLLTELKKFLADTYKQPVVVFEHGKAGQTVEHAHLHLLPTQKNIFATLKQFKKTNYFKKPYSYLFIEQNNRRYIFLAEKQNVPPGFLTSNFAKALGQPTTAVDRKLPPQQLTKITLKIKQQFFKWQKQQN